MLKGAIKFAFLLAGERQGREEKEKCESKVAT